MQKERLLLLADRLAVWPPDNFNMHIWRCGSVVCAGGLACTMSEFNDLGLRMDWHDCPRFGVSNGGFALTLFFDLTNAETDHIFYTDGYTENECDNLTPLFVAERIRAMVAAAKDVVPVVEKKG